MNLYNAVLEAKAALERKDYETVARLLHYARAILADPETSERTDAPVARCCSYMLPDGRIHCGENEMREDDGAMPSRGEQFLFLGTPEERRAACQFCAAMCRAEIIRIEQALADR